MNIFKMILQLLPFVTEMMQIAERAQDGGPKTGEEKKEMVTGATKAVVDAVVSVSTGGQAETWGIIGKVIDPFIDAACSIFNAIGIFKK